MGGGNSLAAPEKDCYLGGSDSAASEMVGNYYCCVACGWVAWVASESDYCLYASAEIGMGFVGNCSAAAWEREVL